MDHVLHRALKGSTRKLMYVRAALMAVPPALMPVLASHAFSAISCFPINVFDFALTQHIHILPTPLPTRLLQVM